jgi:hypothetical protein
MKGETPVSWFVIEPGWEVVARGGETVGKVDEIVGDTADDIFDGLTFKPSPLARPKYVEAERVGTIMPGRVQLTLTADEARRLDDYATPARSEQILPATASWWQRIAGWFRLR